LQCAADGLVAELALKRRRLEEDRCILKRLLTGLCTLEAVAPLTAAASAADLKPTQIVGRWTGDTHDQKSGSFLTLDIPAATPGAASRSKPVISAAARRSNSNPSSRSATRNPTACSSMARWSWRQAPSLTSCRRGSSRGQIMAFSRCRSPAIPVVSNAPTAAPSRSRRRWRASRMPCATRRRRSPPWNRLLARPLFPLAAPVYHPSGEGRAALKRAGRDTPA
jgi:hypothetical protein